MIRVLCLNPVIDRIYFIDGFRAASKFYEVAPQVYVGGKGVNIARVLRLMGEPCVLYGFVGGNNGRLVEEEMRALQVDFRAFHTPGETRTTINIIDNQNRRETEITEPGIEIGKRYQEEFLALLKQELDPGDMVVCSGIPMLGMDADIYRRISGLCAERGCRCVLDAAGIYLREAFPGKYFFSKPNFSELAQLFGLSEDESPAAVQVYGKRMKDMGVDHLMVSMGGDGCLVFQEDTVFWATVPQVPVVSTIGSGDATVAGFCIAASRGMDEEDCIRLAMACGTCNAQYSKVGYIEPDQVQALCPKIKVQPL